MRPQLADDYNPSRLKVPVLVQPKIDGVRGINLDGNLVGRSLKPFANTALTEKFSGKQFLGLDGELAVGPETSPSLCRDTTSAVNTINRHADDVVWHVLDLVTEKTVKLSYSLRFEMLKHVVFMLKNPQIVVVKPCTLAYNLGQVEDFDAGFLAMGYEGTILRNPDAAYKEGRPSTVYQQYMRIKRFSDAEAVVLDVIEGRQNLNEAIINALGRTERSTHAQSMVPNGKVGSLLCRDVRTRQEISVSAGAMTEAERVYYFQQPKEIIGKTITYKTFSKGVKDLPRFPTFKHIRAAADIGG